MKKIYIFLTLLFSLSIIGCDKDECPVCHECDCVCLNVDNVNDTAVFFPDQVDNISDTLKSGTWYISYFLEDGETETSNYNGNSFAFTDSGIVTVNIPGPATIISGNWRIGSDNEHKELYLDFTHSGKFEDLNEDWDVTECTSGIISLKELCDDGILDYLIFSKTK
jgi:hypothetical protein